MLKQKNFYGIEDLRTHIATRVPTLFHSSQTSTVIPFEKIQGLLNENTVLGNLSHMEKSLYLDEEKNLCVRGGVTWLEAKNFARSQGREVMTSPTEELASVLGGIATSATGERSFGFKNLRSQIVEIEYMDHSGVIQSLLSNKKLDLGFDLTLYQNQFAPFSDFKNGPFPRLEFETDLMTGTEGQLGVIVACKIKTIAYEEESYLFLKLPKWEEDYNPHLELFQAVQKFRGRIRACEMLDANSLSYLSSDLKVGNNEDVIFLEIRKIDFEFIYENLISSLTLIKEENIFEMTPSKCRELRMSVPRAIFEVNTRMGVTKKGTDVQVHAGDFSKLMDFYRGYTNSGVSYNLFGHFGDAHLHFNFMPTQDKNEFCNQELEKLYLKVGEWNGSPFAEHGIGLLKRQFISAFYSDTQKSIFKKLKSTFDPSKQFFNEGFMTW